MGLVRKGKELQAKDMPDCGALEVGEVQLQDINGDGAPEVFVNIGSTCLYGAAENGISLFIKNKAGQWHRELGFGAMLSAISPQKNKGYADLCFGRPGFCEDVWRWDGKTDKHFKERRHCARQLLRPLIVPPPSLQTPKSDRLLA